MPFSIFELTLPEGPTRRSRPTRALCRQSKTTTTKQRVTIHRTPQRSLLDGIRSQLSVARTRLAALQAQLAHDRKVLVAQLVASYEAPPPDIATVILQAHGARDELLRR